MEWPPNRLLVNYTEAATLLQVSRWTLRRLADEQLPVYDILPTCPRLLLTDIAEALDLPPPVPPTRLNASLTLQSVAAYLAVSRSTLCRLLTSGRLECRRVRGHRRVTSVQLRAFITSCKRGAE